MLVEGSSPGVVAGAAEEFGEGAEARGHIGVLGAEGPLPDLQHPLE